MRIFVLFTLLAAPAFADETLAGKACRSVHVGYDAPEGSAFVNEVVVRDTAPGTYFCVCGFSKGYFGLQDLGRGKKVVIFSVWDPAAGEDPAKVPEEKRVKLVAKGDGTRVGRFGNEGTGGQSFRDVDWKVGEAYRFCVTATADGADRTAFAGHFYDPAAKAWAHVATFSTITGGKLLGGYYSFVEDFRRDGESLKHARKAEFRGGWVKTAKGAWIDLTAGRFTGDANPATNIDAGPTADGFFLATGGETKNATTKLKDSMIRAASAAKEPADVPGK